MRFIAISRHDDNDAVTIMQIKEGRDVQTHVDKWNTKFNRDTGKNEKRFQDISWREIREEDIPEDYSYREAWTDKFDTDTIDVDPDKKAAIDARRKEIEEAPKELSLEEKVDVLIEDMNQRRLNGEDLHQEADDLLGKVLAGKRKAKT